MVLPFTQHNAASRGTENTMLTVSEMRPITDAEFSVILACKASSLLDLLHEVRFSNDQYAALRDEHWDFLYEQHKEIGGSSAGMFLLDRKRARC